MAKTDRPYDSVDLSSALRGRARQPKFHDSRPIHGFDTETVDGEIFAMSMAFDGREPEIVMGDPVDPATVLDYLTARPARSGVCVWYNLSFDAAVLIRALASPAKAAELHVTGEVTVGENDDHEVFYIPGKMLRIKDANGQVYEHYDIAQFFFAPLDKAAKEWLDMGKLDDVDAEKFGRDEDGQLNQYITDHLPEIQRYAKRDARITRDLWRQFVTVAEGTFGVPCGMPISTGYIGSQYMATRLEDREKPHLFRGSRADKMAWDSYNGGRFEVFKRGDVGPVAGPDINSAYPAVMADLPDPGTLAWSDYGDYDAEAFADADLGYVTATVSTDPDKKIQPFEQKRNVLTWPVMDGDEITVIADTFHWAVENGYVADYDVERAVLGFETDGTDYPFSFVHDLYDERNRQKAAGNDQAQHVLKIVLNSMYGKMIETVKKTEYVPDMSDDEYANVLRDDGLKLLDCETYVSDDAFFDGFDGHLVERLEAGSWFNPHLAAHITGRTRLQLMDATVRHGLEDALIMMATDCLMFERGPFEASGFDAEYGDELGEWDDDYAGDSAFVVGAGLYEVELGDGEHKTQCRGHNIDDGDLRRAVVGGVRAGLEDEPLTTRADRPRSLGEHVFQGVDFNDIGFFESMDKPINPDMDSKRQWPDETSWRDLLDKCQTSRPL